VNSFDPFLSHLGTIRDPRRAEGKLYQLPYVLLFSILAIVTGANSYLGIRTYIKVHLKRLNKAFKIDWQRPPAHTAIRYILQGLNPADVEKVFREHAADLNSSKAATSKRILAFDGKALTVRQALRGSFDAFNDAKARQILSALAVDTALVLAHIEIDEKSNEIPAVQKLLEELDVAGHIVTLDAMHCRKTIRNRRRCAGASDRSVKRQPADPVPQGRGCLQRHQASFTDLPVDRNTVVELAACGRARWKIENESFNTLKTKGYNLEHNFGHGKQHLSAVLATLNLLAFTFHTVVELTHDLRLKAINKTGARTRFFERMRSITVFLVFSSWQQPQSSPHFLK